MSFQLMAWASEQKTGSPTRKAVLLALANAANHHSGVCCPSVERLAEDTELGVTAVKDALKKLVDDGLIERKRRRRGDGSLGTYDYFFPRVESRQAADQSREASVEPEPRGVPQEPGSEPSNREVEPLSREPQKATYDPVKGVRVADGQDLAWNALAAATASYGRANGARMTRALRSIREEVWDEIQRTRGVTAERLAGHEEEYERGLAHAIEVRAGFLIREKPELTWGPEGVARWWSRAAQLAGASTDLEAVADRAVEMARLGQ